MLYTVSVLMSGLTLTKTWTTLDLGTSHSGHLIAIKGTDEPVQGAINHKNVKRIIFEIGYESGIDGEPLIVNTIELNFDDITTTDKGISDRTAFKQIYGFPSKCYIRVKEIEYKTPENTDLFKQSAIASIYTTSDLNKTCNIDINVAPLDFA